jgi:DNA (cytosine-5)-methyltransferase 1
MNYLSLCSGIEAASVAWHKLGWKPFGFSEIEPFPSAILAHHWPEVPNLGDMTKFDDWQNLHEVDLLVGGTPCQAFSLAGLRKSLDDARGNLTLTYVSILNKIDHERSIQLLPPAICVWENVPGVLNTKDNAFGCFLAALAGEDVPLVPSGGKWTNAGYVRGPQRTIAWRVIDAKYFGVAQRRRRVFVVASAREGFCPEQVLFEFKGVRRDTAPSRETGQAVTSDTGTGFTPSSFGAYGEGVGTLRSTGGDLGGGSETLVTTQYGEIAGSLTARHDSSPCADRGQNMVAIQGTLINRKPENGPQGSGHDESGVMYTLTKTDVHAVAYGFNGDQSAKTRSMGEREEQAPTLRSDGPAHVATAFAFDSLASNSMKSPNPHSGCREVDLSKALDTGRGLDPSCNQGGIGVVAYAFDGYNQTLSDTSQTIRSDKSDGDHVGMVLTTQPPIGIDEEWNAKVDGFGTLKARMSGGGFQGSVMQPNLQVRRLTPVECHRLQGFPDDHCKIPWRGKSVEDCPDSPQYKALGNSMAVPCMAWIGKRIDNLLFGDFEI